MNHEKIARENVVERYLMGQLPPEEAELFEDHFFGCQQCFQEVKEAEQTIRAIKEAGRDGLLQVPETQVHARLEPGFLDRLKNLVARPVFSFAAAALVLAMIYPAWQGLVTVSQLKEENQKLREQPTQVKSHHLKDQTRFGAFESAQVINVEPTEDVIVLTFNLLEQPAVAKSYRGEICDQHGTLIWQAKNLRGWGEYETFSLAFHRSFFQEGSYELRLQTVDSSGGTTVTVATFLFSVVLK